MSDKSNDWIVKQRKVFISCFFLGQSGLGKSTLINSLFMTDLYEDTVYGASPQRMPRTTEVCQYQSVISVYKNEASLWLIVHSWD